MRVSTSVDVSDAWQLRVTLMRRHTALGLPLLRSSVVGTARTGYMHRTIVAGAGAGGRVPVVLRVSRSAFGHGDLVLVVRALNKSGTVATLLVPLQNAPSVAGCS